MRYTGLWVTDDFPDRYSGKTDSFVELKTSLSIRGPQDETKFEKSVSCLNFDQPLTS
jgi:hypothetical protein